MFLAILAACVVSIALIKLGSLTVWVAVLGIALKLSLLAIVVLAALLAYKAFKKS
jgi:hypothetical protein